MQKNLAISILVCGFLALGILALAGLTPTVDGAAGLPHPQLTGMLIGGDGSARLEPIKMLAFVIQIIVLAQFACLIALGVSEHRRNKIFYIALTACYLCAALVWWRMFADHQYFLATGETGYVLGFPTATAWQVYGVWLSGLSFLVLYVVGFKHYIWSDQDEEAFQALVNTYTKNNNK